MHILVINCGSTSIKGAIVNSLDGSRPHEFKMERLGTDKSRVVIDDQSPADCPSTHEAALREVLPEFLKRSKGKISAVGHRVVHGGDKFTRPTILDKEVMQAIDDLSRLAPLHNPPNLAGIRAARELVPDIPHIAVFDTAFHGTLPPRSRTYAIPHELAEQHAIRRYGFHGTSHQYVAERAAAFVQDDLRNLRIITLHLGGGCSACAVEYGRSVETSMGMTPLEGLVMGTRSGDIDAGALLHLLRDASLTVDQLDELLNRRSGLAGLSGIGNDMRDIELRAEQGNDNCRRAVQVFCHRVRKYIGAYAAVMGGVDIIVFTGGIGENSATVRHRVAQRLDFLGARFDEDRNRDVRLSRETPVAEVSTANSRVRILAIATDELHSIAKQAHDVCQSLQTASQPKKIPVAISARHLHLRQETVEALFGSGHQLTNFKPLSQPGQFAAEQCVTLIGPKRSIEGVRILGPTRSKDQVEISRTDEFYLGLDAPIRRSGDIENTPGITIEGTDGRRVTLEKGVICAWRHIHMTPQDAQLFDVDDGDVVEVEVGHGSGRSLTFGDVLIRVKDSYRLEMHIDTDEGNAAELRAKDVGELESTDASAQLKST